MANVVVFAPHPDDAEIGMGGTIIAMCKAGINVSIVDLTNGEPTPYGTPELRASESNEASKILGINERVTLDIPNRLVFDNEENRRKVAIEIRRLKPEIIFIPYWEDGHPDHWQACQLCEAGRFWAKLTKIDLDFEPHYPRKILHFFSTHIRTRVDPTFIFDTSDFHSVKLDAIKAYKSQFELNPKNTAVYEKVDTENKFWGRRIGVKFGEPFICRESIAIKSAKELLNV